MNRQELENFINYVFNYYNGKINLINSTAVLNINWSELYNNEAGGYSIVPNIVCINPMVIARFYSESNLNTLKVAIVETIIHELYHTDQIIDQILYDIDPNYKHNIECACELQTITYMANHQSEISNLVGDNITIAKEDYRKLIDYWGATNASYYRRHYNDHIIMCISNIVGDWEYSTINQNIVDGKDTYLVINNEFIPIIEDGIRMPMKEFNNIINKYLTIFPSKLYDVAKATCDYYTDKIFIRLKVNIGKTMCTKVSP